MEKKLTYYNLLLGSTIVDTLLSIVGALFFPFIRTGIDATSSIQTFAPFIAVNTFLLLFAGAVSLLMIFVGLMKKSVGRKLLIRGAVLFGTSVVLYFLLAWVLNLTGLGLQA
jgi:hypothetical protein